MPATSRRRSVGSRSTAASPTTPARIEASVPLPLCSSSIAPTTVTGGSALGVARQQRLDREGRHREPRLHVAGAAADHPAVADAGAKGGDDQSRSSPAGTTSRWPFRIRRRAPFAAQPADDDRAAVVRPGPTPAAGRARCRRGTGRARPPADPLELGGEHVLGALLGARHARLAHERIEERERPVGAVVDAPRRWPAAEWCLGWAISPNVPRHGNGVGRTSWAGCDQRATSCCEPRTRTPPENVRAYQPRSMRLIDTTRPVSGACTKRSPPT